MVFLQNGNQRYKYVVLGYLNTYFVKDQSDNRTKYSEVRVIKTLEFLINKIQRTDFSANSLHSNGHKLRPLTYWLISLRVWAVFIQEFEKAGKKHLAERFNFTYR